MASLLVGVLSPVMPSSADEVEAPAVEEVTGEGDETVVDDSLTADDVEVTDEVISDTASAPTVSTEDGNQESEGAVVSGEPTAIEEPVAEDVVAEDSVESDVESGNFYDTFKGTSWRYVNGLLRSGDVSLLANEDLVSWKKDGTDYVGSNGVRVKGAYSIGIDVSQWNGAIDWAKVKAAGIDFAIIRCGWGDTGVDTSFFQNVKGCQQNGIPFGVYLYSYTWDYESATWEADNALSLLEQAGLDPSDLALPVFFDMENVDPDTMEPAGQTDTGEYKPISNDNLAQMAKAFCGKLSSKGYKTGVYSSRSWFMTYLTDPIFDMYPRWVADWTGTGSSLYTGDYDWWQCMETGKVDGVSTAVDINFFYLKSADLAAEHRGDLADGTYSVRVSNSSSAVLDVRGGSLSAGAQVNLWSRKSTGDNQLWEATHDESGFVRLESVTSGHVLGVASAAQGAKLAQLEDTGDLSQRWVAVREGSSYKLVCAADPSLVLDAQGGKTSDGTRAELYADNGGANQRWALSATEPLLERLDALAAANRSALPDGTYALRPSHASGKALDVQGASSSSGANANLWSYGGRSNQAWRVTHDADGYVTLTNVLSGKALDSSGSNVK